MLRPIHVAVLHEKHLTLPATGFKRRNDPIVHRGSRPLVLSRVNRQTRGEQGLLLVWVNTPISLRLVAGSNADPEAMTRTRREQRRILEASPIDRRPQMRGGPYRQAPCTHLDVPPMMYSKPPPSEPTAAR